MLTDATARPLRWSIRDGIPKPRAATSDVSVRNSSTIESSSDSSASSEDTSVARSTRASRRPSPATTAARIFVPPTSTPITRDRSKPASTIRRRMSSPGGDKPYRLYRGGRTKGRVPTAGTRPEKEKRPPRERAQRDGRRRYGGPGPKPTARRPRQIRWSREITIALVLIIIFFVAWTALGYFVFRSGVSDANKRLPQSARSALAPDKGSMLSNPSAILLLGTDHAAAQRSRQRPPLLPVDPTRPARRDSGIRRLEDQHRLPSRWPAPRRENRRRLYEHPGQPPRRRQLRRVQGSDRRPRR